ncbi:hypothetical protein NPX13_g2683 [Xylaria arbuscula]|uniref:Uncharacterized protein n=1 Tax=Xylaria arbuscula TaxID=114810 RepID=A0A9W8TNX8_9PEZI|nr:hypothetical protein NPX13_g2683 [Xylaria arbuscula]
MLGDFDAQVYKEFVKTSSLIDERATMLDYSTTNRFGCQGAKGGGEQPKWANGLVDDADAALSLPNSLPRSRPRYAAARVVGYCQDTEPRMIQMEGSFPGLASLSPTGALPAEARLTELLTGPDS